MLEVCPASPAIRQGEASPHLELNLPGPLLSPPSSFSTLQDDFQTSPSPSKDKHRKPVPISARGGLGNIRARKKSQLNVASPKSPSRQSSSPSFSRFRRTFSAGSGSISTNSTSTRSTLSSGASIRSNVDSIAVTIGSGSASLMSGSDDDYLTRAWPSMIGSPLPDDVSVSEPSSPRSATYASPLAPPTPGSAGAKAGSTGTTSVASDYVLHLHADARQRAMEKRLARERAREARLLAGVADGIAGLGVGLDGEDGKGAEGGEGNVEEKVVKLRSGRGGAGAYKKVGGSVDPALHPRAANITREYEERAAALERNIVAASRARSALQGSTGRGGAGNVGVVGKKINKKKGAKDAKGKGRADMVETTEREETLEERASREGHVEGDEATCAIDDEQVLKKDKKKGPGLRKLWKRVVRSNGDLIPDSASYSSASQSDKTPRPSVGDSILEIGRPSSPLPSCPSVSASAYPSPAFATPSSVPSSPRIQGSSKLRKHAQSREELREGAALLAFVNAALPDLPGSRNVLGVPGTPGFPLPGGKTCATVAMYRGQMTPSSRSSTPITGQAATNASTSDVDVYERGEVPVHEPRPMKPVETVVEEQSWVDNETLQEFDGVGMLNADEEEDEDSDIDPQVHPSAPKQHHQYSLPRTYYEKRPDSLDVVIRVALDKLDRAEIKDKEDRLAEEDEEGIIDAYAFTGNAQYDSRGPPRFPSSRFPGQIQRSTSALPSPSSFIRPSTPRYLRASAPALPARFNAGTRVMSRSWSDAGKPQVRVPVAGPPPARPVPQLPEGY